MGRLAKFYNQNRYIVWLVILIIIAIIALIQILNNFAAKKISTEENIIIQNVTTSTTIDNNYSVITGKDVKEETSQIIDDFINYCNNQEVEEAYELLSEECKEVLYPTLETFTEKYYKKLFTAKKSYLYQAWITNNNTYTYKVDFVEDMLATGKASDTSITDYYTVVKNNDEYELNINKFIGITDINKTETKNNITIKINRKRIYMDYETYEIELTNNSTKEVMLDSLQKTNTVYVEDENEGQYYWYSHEILEEDILVRKAQSKEMEIRFNKEYRPQNEVTKIVFSKITINEENAFKMEILL